MSHAGSGVRINCISPGQIDVGIDLKGFDMRGMKSQLPPANLQSAEASHVPHRESKSDMEIVPKSAYWSGASRHAPGSRPGCGFPRKWFQ